MSCSICSHFVLWLVRGALRSGCSQRVAALRTHCRPLQPGEPSPPPTRLPKPRLVVTRPVAATAMVTPEASPEKLGERLEFDRLLSGSMLSHLVRYVHKYTQE